MNKFQKKIPESRRDSMVNLESTEKTSSTNSLQVPPIARRRSGSIPAVRLSLVSLSAGKLYMKGGVKRFQKVKSVREIFYNTAFVDSMADHSLRRHSSQSIATLRDHTHFFVSLISQVIQAFDCAPYETLEHIDKIGSFSYSFSSEYFVEDTFALLVFTTNTRSSHASLKKYGFKDSMWDKLGELVIDAFVVQVC
ncbi:unnamed protein product [Anisakis simplex]|uniref:CDT1 domain-containing protein n=1 Tax=Anisakis simplex TaxID=6269 RepID=A0A0M3KJ00_ANISI|nr:unnamed protein product [Anisakis simplex]